MGARSDFSLLIMKTRTLLVYIKRQRGFTTNIATGNAILYDLKGRLLKSARQLKLTKKSQT